MKPATLLAAYIWQMRTTASWVLLILLTTTLNTLGQTTRTHGVFWGRLVLADRIGDRWRGELYLEKRTQNIPGETSPFGSHYIKNVRFWAIYSASQTVKLGISPIAYFNTHSFLSEPSDVGDPSVKEFRWAARLEHVQKLKPFNFINRYTLEYRRRDLNHDNVFQPNWRVRYMVRLEKPVTGILRNNAPVSFSLANEVLLQFGKAVRRNPNVFDQNRISAGVTFPVVRNVNTTFSYLNIIQQRSNGKDFDLANALWFTLTFDNLFSQL